MSWDIELAKNFKNRDNPKIIGVLIGNVISISPIKISILDNKVILTSKNSYICSRLIENNAVKADININSTISSGEIVFKEVLKQGDRVLCLPTYDGQRFFIIDKVVI